MDTKLPKGRNCEGNHLTDNLTSGCGLLANVRASTFDGERCRVLRERRIGRQEDLAKIIGVTVFTISRWENGKSQPHPHHFRALCEALRVEPIELIASA
jgi:DNA-binding XRE family transcriptional regulator